MYQVLLVTDSLKKYLNCEIETQGVLTMIMVLIGLFAVMTATYFGYRLIWDILKLIYDLRTDKEDKQQERHNRRKVL